MKIQPGLEFSHLGNFTSRSVYLRIKRVNLCSNDSLGTRNILLTTNHQHSKYPEKFNNVEEGKKSEPEIAYGRTHSYGSLAFELSRFHCKFKSLPKNSILSLAVFRENPRYCYCFGVIFGFVFVVVVVVQNLRHLINSRALAPACGSLVFLMTLNNKDFVLKKKNIEFCCVKEWVNSFLHSQDF